MTTKNFNQNIELKQLLEKTDLSDGQSIERYALHLEGMTFRDVLDLDIRPDDNNENDYADSKYLNHPNNKGILGITLEERYFGYKANSRDEPDFAEAGVELKTTCLDPANRRTKHIHAGEPLSLTMISYEEIEEEFTESNLWKKCRKILLVYYLRDKNLSDKKFDQQIMFVRMLDLTRPEFASELKTIQGDYRKIATKVLAGQADKLTEAEGMYLCAKTKGESRNSIKQYSVTDENGNEVRCEAPSRGFYFTKTFLNRLFQEHDLSIQVQTEPVFEEETLEEHYQRLVEPHIGKTDRELCEEFNVEYTPKNRKSMWSSLALHMLGATSNRAENLVMDAISVRAIRIKKSGNIKEHLSLDQFEFKDLINEKSWNESTLRKILDSTKFFFVVFKEATDEEYLLKGCCFWNMPADDIDGPAKECWERTRDVVKNGVKIEQQFNADGTPKLSKKGKPVFRNNLPKSTDNACVHVRPHAQESFYDFGNGFVVGHNRADASELPDGTGRWMLKQSFWLNNTYVLRVLKNELGNI